MLYERVFKRACKQLQRDKKVYVCQKENEIATQHSQEEFYAYILSIARQTMHKEQQNSNRDVGVI